MSEQANTPQPALKRLEKLVGIWTLTGRTLDSEVDNITGSVTIEWLLDGFFLQQRGEIAMIGFKGQSLEILSYDPETDTFPSLVYSNMGSVPLPYCWDVQGEVVTHWTEGSKYTGTFSEDGNTLSGGWRPVEGVEAEPGGAYDAVMTRRQ